MILLLKICQFLNKNILLNIEKMRIDIMRNRLIIDGNAVYEIDEECVSKREEEERNKNKRRKDTIHKRNKNR